jgi:hypothetical protein
MASACIADEIEAMIDMFKQNEVLWRVNHWDYNKR